MVPIFQFYMSPKLAIVGLTIVPPVAGLAILYGRFVRKITKSLQVSNAIVVSRTIIFWKLFRFVSGHFSGRNSRGRGACEQHQNREIIQPRK